MQQRQLRLGDILDDYCPRERRVTNHAVVAMVGDDVKQTRCSTCETEHEYKHAKVPRQRKKAGTPAALYSQVLANGPKKVAHDALLSNGSDAQPQAPAEEPGDTHVHELSATAADNDSDDAPPGRDEGHEGDDGERADRDEDGPVHRPLIRASLPKIEGQQPPSRPIPEFTIRQPAGRQNRFRPRHQPRSGGGGFGGGQGFQGNRSNGPGGPPRGMRSGGGRPPHPGVMTSSRPARRNGPPDRKRSK
jgi:hypothetical protein